jgi:hypothetical protein
MVGLCGSSATRVQHISTLRFEMICIFSWSWRYRRGVETPPGATLHSTTAKAEHALVHLRACALALVVHVCALYNRHLQTDTSARSGVVVIM